MGLGMGTRLGLGGNWDNGIGTGKETGIRTRNGRETGNRSRTVPGLGMGMEPFWDWEREREEWEKLGENQGKFEKKLRENLGKVQGKLGKKSGKIQECSTGIRVSRDWERNGKLGKIWEK